MNIMQFCHICYSFQAISALSLQKKDYGTITWNGEYGMFGDSEITDDSIRSDGNSVCFEVAGDDENILYIFFPEEEK